MAREVDEWSCFMVEPGALSDPHCTWCSEYKEKSSDLEQTVKKNQGIGNLVRKGEW